MRHAVFIVLLSIVVGAACGSVPGPEGPIGPQGAQGPPGTISNNGIAAGAVLYSDGTNITGDGAAFYWNDTTNTLVITQGEGIGAAYTALKVRTDAGGDHGYGAHIEIAGNPGGGGTIWRTDGGDNKSWLQIYGGDYSGTSGGQLYLNGIFSTDGDGGGVQVATAITGASFQVLDGVNEAYTTLFSVNSNDGTGTVTVPSLAASSMVATDANSNLVSVVSIPYTVANPASWTGSPPTTIQEALDRIAAALGPI